MITRHANERRQYGVPIGSFQRIRAQLADSAIEIASGRLLVLEAARDFDRGLDSREKVPMVKIRAPEVLGRVDDRAVQVFGGLAYCKDLPVERIYGDRRVMRTYDGTSEIDRGLIAKGLLRRGAAAVIPSGKPARCETGRKTLDPTLPALGRSGNRPARALPVRHSRQLPSGTSRGRG